MELHQVPLNQLDKYITDHLQPTKEFQEKAGDAIDRICTFLRERCFSGSPTKVLKTVKGGSAGKGTALQNGSDADLVVFLSCFSSYTQQWNDRCQIIEEIRITLQKCWQSLAFDINISEPKVIPDKRNPFNPRSLSFTMKSTKKSESIEVDVLPAYDVLGQVNFGTKPDPQVYVNLIKTQCDPGDFSTCFTELQRDFVKRRPTKLKSLLRLVKHWYKRYVKQGREGQELPAKYALELLTIYVWEKGSGKEDFKTEEGFRTVLEVICNYKHICIYWTEYYDIQHEFIGKYLKKQLSGERPIILDPADPTGNVASRGRWDLLAEEAKKLSIAANTWDVKVRKLFLYKILDFFSILLQLKSRFPSLSHSHTHTRISEKIYNIFKITDKESNINTSRSWDPFIGLFFLGGGIVSHNLQKMLVAFLVPQKRIILKTIFFHFSQGKKKSIVSRPQEQGIRYNRTTKRFRKIIRTHSITPEPLKGNCDNTAYCEVYDSVDPFMTVTGLKSQIEQRTEIFLKNDKGVTHTYTVHPLETVTDFKKKVEKVEKVPVDQQRLLYGGRQLEDGHKLYDYNIEPESTIFLTLRGMWVYFNIVKLGGVRGPSPFSGLKGVRTFHHSAGTTWGRGVGLTGCGINLSPPPNKILKTKGAVKLIKEMRVFNSTSAITEINPLTQLLSKIIINDNTKAHSITYVLIRPSSRLSLKCRPHCVHLSSNRNNPKDFINNYHCFELQARKMKLTAFTVPADNFLYTDQKWVQHVVIDSSQSLLSLRMDQWVNLYQTPAHCLDKYIYNYLQPTEEFHREVGEAIRRTCDFLRRNCFQSHSSIRVTKIIQGGSAGKGTALKNGSDADLVVFLRCCTNYEDQKNNRDEILQEIHRTLARGKQRLAYNIKISKPKTNTRSLSFTMTSTVASESIKVDVLPAFSALGKRTTASNGKPDPQVYIDLINEEGSPGEFSPCFTELQRDFVKHRPTKVKNLIRLVKHWYKECVKPRRQEGHLPPKYALELLTLHIWETGSGMDYFRTEEGFRTVLEMICNYENICVYWTEYYDFQNEVIRGYLESQLNTNRPIILDPADPTGNVADRGQWELLAEEARICLSKPCVRNVKAWNV
uniref:2'-5' oligoadenylate synthase n=1 Tax=Latimeria chalumnae TaxID=7897 RepID=H3BDE9_LATCH